MGHHGIVFRDGEKRRLRVHNNVPHALSVSQSHEDVFDVFPAAFPAEDMRDTVLGGTGKSTHMLLALVV